MVTVYTYWWYGGSLKSPGLADIPYSPSSGAFLPATLPFTL